MAITRSGKNRASLQAALQQDDAVKVREIAGRLDLSKAKIYRNTCLAAARAGASNSLEALLEAGGGFRFDDNQDYYCRYNARKMIEEALASRNPAPVLSVIYHANKKEAESRTLSDDNFINKDAPTDVIHGCLEKNPDFFKPFMKVSGLDPTESSTEKLKAILAYTVAAAPDSQAVLNDALIAVAATGDVEKTKLLLEQQADPNATAAQSLLNASKGGHKEHEEIVGLLLLHVTPELCSDVLKRLQLLIIDPRPQHKQEKIDDEIIAAIETAAQRVTTAEPEEAATPPEQQNTQGYRAVDADTLELNQTLSDGTRRVIYDFVNELREITVTIKGASVPSMSTVNFDDIKKEITKDKRRILDELNHKPRPGKPLNRLTVTTT